MRWQKVLRVAIAVFAVGFALLVPLLPILALVALVVVIVKLASRPAYAR